jgi:hypothetical protein
MIRVNEAMHTMAYISLWAYAGLAIGYVGMRVWILLKERTF